MLWDEQADVYLVSNINGTPFAKDDNGFITRVTPGDEPALGESPWIDGKRDDVTLDAPKGMALVGDPCTSPTSTSCGCSIARAARPRAR
jgi:hypothetical protein